jgi:hypothetical protein
MSDDVFESWKRQRAQADVPSDFAAGVMSHLPAPRQWASTLLRVAACLLAGLACLFRIVSVLGLFLPS